MSRVRPDQLRRQLAKAPPSGSYYVHGSQPVLRDEAVAMLLDAALDPAMRDFNLDILSAQQIDPDALEAACATLPMMAERRVVVLRDVEAWKRKTKAKQPAVAYLERPAAETVLVMVQGATTHLTPSWRSGARRSTAATWRGRRSTSGSTHGCRRPG